MKRTRGREKLILRNFFRRRATGDDTVLDAPPLQVTFPAGKSFAVEEFGRALRERGEINDEQGGKEAGGGKHKLGEEKNKNATSADSQDQGSFRCTTDLGLSERE